MTNKKTRKRVLPLIIVIAAVIIAAVIFNSIRNASKSIDVYPVSELLQSNWEDDSLSGEVTEGRVQNIQLKDGIVDEICVSEGQSVKAGDVLMKYDTESFQLTIKSDEAKISSLESAINKSKQELEKYKTIIPSEYAPTVEPTTIHHTAEPVDTISEINEGTAPSEQGEVRTYYCTSETVVKADFLKSLYENSSIVQLNVYDENVLYATWTIDGNTLGDSPYAKKINEITPEPTKEPIEEDDKQDEETEPTEEAEPNDGAEQTGDETVIDNETNDNEESKDETAKIEFEDWTIGDGISYNGDGTANIDFSSPHYGTLDTVVPEEAEWDETIYPEEQTSDGENYTYSKDELAKMIQDKTKEIESQNLSLREAKLNYEKDKLTYNTGEVKATIDGVVTELKDVAGLSSGGDVMKIKGTEKAVVTVAVSELELEKLKTGDKVNITGYESGVSAVGTINEIGTEPLTAYSSYGANNPNSSYYPAKAYVEDEGADLKTGENCQVTLQNSSSQGGKYLPIMYIRSDTNGKYVMADSNGKLVKKYIKTGKSLWGYVLEIKSGIDENDKIAFPYGKNAQEGVSTKEADVNYY